MPTLKKTFVVQRPQQEVFDYLSQVSKHGEWSPKPWRVEGEPGPLAKGATFSSRGWIPGEKDHQNEVEVTEFEPPSRIAWRAHEKGQPFISTFVLTPEGSGTSVERTFEFPQQTGFIGVIFPVIKALIVKPNFEKGASMLKQRLESGGAASPAS
jgi:uncharacterized protein YndB with AHSA1/START domain